MNTQTAEQANFQKLEKEMNDLLELATKAKAAAEQQYKDLSTHYAGVKADNEELKSQVQQHTKEYAEMVASIQTLQTSIEMVKKELDAPVYRSNEELARADREAAVELQRRAFLAKNGADAAEQFRPDMDNLVNIADYRKAAQKLVKYGGLKSKAEVMRMFDEHERKAFDAASLDTAFFSPEILGMVDCNIECSNLLDLYGQVTVGRSTFMYPQVVDYGQIGEYGCDVDCDAPLGEEGNIQFIHGKTYDFRGMFCFLRKVLEEANFDFLSFMIQAAQRSYRLNRNRALMVGDGVQEPLGWLEAKCFTEIATPAGAFDHVVWRRFLTSSPIEYGSVVPVMHQNMFAYLAAAVDNNGRFIFGDGQMTYSPESAGERIRISNCLPDATENNTLGSADAPFVAGSFIAALANWDTAYKAVTRKPMSMEQYIGGSSKWCVKYQFGAEDGAFVGCCGAGRILRVGA
jgi:hypothetical protein